MIYKIFQHSESIVTQEVKLRALERERKSIQMVKMVQICI